MGSAIPVPLWLRLPAGALLVAWGASTDRRWTVPVAAMLALPAMWYGGLCMILAVLFLRTDPAREAASPGSQAGDESAVVTGRSTGALASA